jgi:hypothetical protein
MAHAESALAPLVLTLITAGCLFSQTTVQVTVKDKATDYPVHADVGAVSIGAEYLVHSIPAHSQTFFAPDYLVVDVAVFPGRLEPVEIGTNTFTLRINGRKEVIFPDTPGFVAASLTYPDWEQHRRAEVQAGVGDAGVTIGRPPVVGRFPDDPTPGHSRLPPAPKAPTPEDQQGIERDSPQSADEALAQVALPDGPVSKPIAGYIFFHHRGKAKSIKSLDLVFEGKQGSVTLKLF